VEEVKAPTGKAVSRKTKRPVEDADVGPPPKKMKTRPDGPYTNGRKDGPAKAPSKTKQTAGKARKKAGQGSLCDSMCDDVGSGADSPGQKKRKGRKPLDVSNISVKMDVGTAFATQQEIEALAYRTEMNKYKRGTYPVNPHRLLGPPEEAMDRAENALRSLVMDAKCTLMGDANGAPAIGVTIVGE
jgi:hypothetical protein